MLSNVHTFTPAGKIKKPSYSTVATWIKESWDEVSDDLIRKSFKCCGVSTKIDGSEDDCLFDYNRLLDPVDDYDEVVDLNNLDDNEENEYSENDYENEWNETGNGNDNEGDEGEDENENGEDYESL